MKKIKEEFLEKVKNKKDYFSFIHMADSHNGHRGNNSKYNEFSSLKISKTNHQGVNIRQADIEKAFEEIIDLAIKLDVNSILHAGDGWDAVAFPDRTVDNHYTKVISKLTSHQISYVEIVGNHNLPKKIGKGCFLETLGRFPNVHTAYKGVYEKVVLEDNVTIHCVPSTYNQDLLDESLNSVTFNKHSEGIHIGIGHFGLTNIPFYAENNEKSLVTTLDKLMSLELDYFALGDFHKATTFSDSIRYSGSIVRLGMGEISNQPQVFICAINKQTKECHVEPYFLESRKMFDLGPVNAFAKTIEEINSEIEELLRNRPLTDAIVRLRINKLPSHLKASLNTALIDTLTSDALYFKLELKDKIDDSLSIRTNDDIEFDGILEGWISYMDKVEDDGTFDKLFVTKKGYEKLSEILER